MTKNLEHKYTNNIKPHIEAEQSEQSEPIFIIGSEETQNSEEHDHEHRRQHEYQHEHKHERHKHREYQDNIALQRHASDTSDIEHSASDKSVNEESWTDDLEFLLVSWRAHITEMSQLHEEAGRRIKKKHYIIGLPTIVIPLFMTFIQVLFGELSRSKEPALMCEYNIIGNIVNSLMFLLSSILSQIYTSYDLGTRSTLHFQYSARYYDLIIRIDSELSRKRKVRTSADVFMTDIRCNINNLNTTGPNF